MGWDIKKLGEKLKVKGLVLAEDGAELVVNEVFDWAIAEAVASENKIDDIVAVILPAIKPFIMQQVDKIDNIEGN